jgi:trehalose synthase-fused probable maltokinase
MDETALSSSAFSPPVPPTIRLSDAWDWNLVIAGRYQVALEAALASSIATRRWFGAKSRTIRTLRIVDAIEIAPDARLILIELEFAGGASETYQIPLRYCADEKAASASTLWARLQFPAQQPAVLYDPLGDADFCSTLLALFAGSAVLPAARGELAAWQAPPFPALRGNVTDLLPPKLIETEQSNSSVVFGQRLILKIFRRVEKGINPDLEVTAFLTEHGFPRVSPLAGAIEYRRAGQEPWTLGFLQAFVDNQGDAWRFTLGALEEFLRQAIVAQVELPKELHAIAGGLGGAARIAISPAVRFAFKRFLPQAELLAKRTAELHLALASDSGNAAFAPELYSEADQRASCQRSGELAGETLRLLGDHLPRLQGEAARRAASLLEREAMIYERLRDAASAPVHAAKIRCHGDYHLGQVLVTGDDFVIVDFEGEPARSLAERRQKQLALRDVAGMIRSFHYCSCSAAQSLKQAPKADAERIDAIARAWYFWMSVAFLSAYRRAAAGAVFLPKADREFDRLLDVCLLEKAIYELRYELNNRPLWVYLPLAALDKLLKS